MIEEHLENWPKWGFSEKPSLIRQFTAGKNHHTGLIECREGRHVLKVFEHSFEQAVSAQRLAANIGIAPEIVFADSNTLVMEYVPSTNNSLESLAIGLKTLHASVAQELITFDLMSFYEDYLAAAPEGLIRQHHQILPILNEFIDDPTPWCFCHNDLVTENCVSRNSKTIFIDWEFAGKHNPWFDLAAIVLYRELTHEQACFFLNAYNDWEHKVGERIFLSSQIALLWGDLLWHVSKYGIAYISNNKQRFAKLDSLVRAIK